MAANAPQFQTTDSRNLESVWYVYSEREEGLEVYSATLSFFFLLENCMRACLCV